MADQSICTLSASELAEKIKAREISPVEATEACLDRIDALNGTFLGFVTVSADRARAEAKRAEAEIAAGRYRGPLHGIPYGAKDIIDTASIRTAQGARVFKNNVPDADADCVERLTEAGAVLLGKTNTHQWAAASTTINVHFGTSRNPWNRERIVGGSSGGSAAAVAAAMCPIALGSDTGGSIRTPSALCGIVGLKPTHGRVSLRGVFPNTLSLDHVGPMTRTVRDAAIALQVLAGFDPSDPKSQDAPVPDYTARLEDGVKGARIVVSPDFYKRSEMDGEISAAFEKAVAVFRDLGARVETEPFPDAERFDSLFRRIAGPEFSEVHRARWEADPGAYEDEVSARIEWSVKVPTDDYVRALRDQVLMQREVDRFLGPSDAMIMPSVPVVAPPIATLEARINDRTFDYRMHIHRPFLTYHNITGCPALVLPMGLSRDGLPMSLQVVAARWREADVLRVARAYEQATPELRMPAPCK